jgi:hypothetical protein
MAVQPPEFLTAAKEIDDLISLQRKFRKRSDLTLSELARNIYDRDSKARLLTLVIALVSMTVVLAAKSDATLETVFDVYSEPGSRNFIFFVAFLAAVAFFAFVGLRTFVLTVVDGLASWSIKLFGASMFTEWLLSYLVRDLVNYHGRAMVNLQMKDLPEATNDEAVEEVASNVVQIDSAHTSDSIVE